MQLIKNGFCIGSLIIFGACQQAEVHEQSTLKAASVKEAHQVMTRFLTAYTAGAAEAAVDVLCNQEAAERQQAQAFISRSQSHGSPFRVSAYAIEHIEASWRGKNPVFEGRVRFKTDKDDIRQIFIVDAKRSCIDGLSNHSSEVLPEAMPDAPVGANDQVIDL